MKVNNRKRLLHYLATKFAWLLLLGLGKTARIRLHHVNHWRQVKREKCGLLSFVWHGKMLLPIYVHRKQNISAMVSEHGDGEIIAQTILRFGYRTVRGSSTRGGQRAFVDILRRLKNGEHCTILPDGPNGPRQKLKMGIIVLAQRSGASLLPVTFAAQKPIVINSWDRLTLWRPFSKCILLYGKPIKIPPKLTLTELEEQRLFVEQRLMALEKEADEVFRT
jgi:lysophospholipid acyltransferase (LPLAT)-like uncharacterized protein